MGGGVKVSVLLEVVVHRSVEVVDVAVVVGDAGDVVVVVRKVVVVVVVELELELELVLDAVFEGLGRLPSFLVAEVVVLVVLVLVLVTTVAMTIEW